MQPKCVGSHRRDLDKGVAVGICALEASFHPRGVRFADFGGEGRQGQEPGEEWGVWNQEAFTDREEAGRVRSSYELGLMVLGDEMAVGVERREVPRVSFRSHNCGWAGR